MMETWQMNDETDCPVRTTHLSDAADELGIGLSREVAAGGLLYLGSAGRTVMGRAFTVTQRPVALTPEDPTPITQHGEAAASLASAGDILVIGVQGVTGAATWGEAHTLRAMRRGLAGVLIDGFTRDADALREIGFPVLVQGASPKRSTRRLETVAVGEEVTIAAVTIRPGDLVALDADGFVCVPAEQVATVQERAQAIAHREAARDQQLRASSP
jgi:regulator of RNase E activity RraA